MDNILTITNLDKHFGDNHILKNISLEIKQNTVTTIIGPSGSGKSTLLRCINLLETITSGEIRFKDQVISDSTTNVTTVRSKIGMVFQSFNLFNNLTVLENCTIGPIKVLKEDKQVAIDRALSFLNKVGMIGFKDRNVTTLSGGQKQRVAIARTLCMNPEIILFDEPTSSLDPEMVYEVLEVMRSVMSESISFIVVTHEMDFAKDVSDRIIFMDDGVIIEDGPPSHLFTESTNERLLRFIKR